MRRRRPGDGALGPSWVAMVVVGGGGEEGSVSGVVVGSAGEAEASISVEGSMEFSEASPPRKRIVRLWVDGAVMGPTEDEGSIMR